ncbi:MAG TPA: DNA-3-methyladenine glycosylase [Bacteroidia bacterium]|nr:DNA-3-methyladenine glycosylase [Bacteroidia bacterium]
MLISESFFKRKDVTVIAQELIGKLIYSNFDNIKTGGIITETEAYSGIQDRASHAFGGRRTARTEVMYQEAGTIYVYLCYGIHHLFNIVTNAKDIPDAILIRSIYPVTGIGTIRKRRSGTAIADSQLCVGPGNMTKGLGITINENGTLLNKSKIYITGKAYLKDRSLIQSGHRIGVAYAGKDALLPYRFYVNHRHLEKLDLASG